jgi:PhzF family phenazine biosynthesis protein
MQAVAAEMNLSETAFLLREGEGWRLRWFTPAVEVALCGHATLASARALIEEGLLAEGGRVRFESRSGALAAAHRGDFIELDFPARPEEPCEPPAGLIAALGAEPSYFGRSAEDYIALLPDEQAVRTLAPDFAALRALTERGLMVTAPSGDPRWHFVSRFFAPAVGIDEDPVTGSAHCTLAPFWAGRLGREDLVGRQVSGRGGVVRVRLAGGRVLLGGGAVVVFKGMLLA